MHSGVISQVCYDCATAISKFGDILDAIFSFSQCEQRWLDLNHWPQDDETRVYYCATAAGKFSKKSSPFSLFLSDCIANWAWTFDLQMPRQVLYHCATAIYQFCNKLFAIFFSVSQCQWGGLTCTLDLGMKSQLCSTVLLPLANSVTNLT